MFELLATYTVATLFMAGAWAFDAWMMKEEEQWSRTPRTPNAPHGNGSTKTPPTPT